MSNRGPFVMVDADIMLAPDPGSIGLGDAVGQGNFLIARRTVLPILTGVRALVRGGFDFFAVHAQYAERVDIGLIFGVAWWDHYFPWLMGADNCRAIHAAKPLAFHLEHKERWEWRLCIDLGYRFPQEVLGLLQQVPLPLTNLRAPFGPCRQQPNRGARPTRAVPSSLPQARPLG